MGTAIASILRRRGHTITGVASRTTDSAARAASLLGTVAFSVSDGAVPESDVILIGAPDRAIPSVVSSLKSRAYPGQIVWHVAGSLGIEPLRPLTDRGCFGAAVHPLQACPSVDAALANLPGSSWGVTVSKGLESWAHRLVRDDLAGVPVDVAEQHRPLWHAASITTSTGISAVMSVGESLLTAIGIAHPHETLGPLIEGTINHAFSQGGGGPIVTGPIIRGEVDTVARHLDALSKAADESLVRDYLTVVGLVLERGAAAGRVGESAYEAMRRFLTEAEEGTPVRIRVRRKWPG